MFVKAKSCDSQRLQVADKKRITQYNWRFLEVIVAIKNFVS